ncbi:cytidine deaminase [Azospirillum argentinense]|uniref:Cytidine deaminase n=1 Tax=Azospirillum argentinense TaxID=2970906 RepID=A0A060DE53_9PROT|nr:nucleoside deaminase [Azospirillum argentinense]AIB12406.1 cytidine deaminase [Azospirillum argentinense]EZQ09233.1 cytidine deaminase [Azospirillum argentinense]KAA1056324.1 Guanine deaminase [Azospirillum argentinense]
MTSFDTECLRRAIALSRTHMQGNAGGPFGAVIARDGRIIGEGWNCVTSTNDPTAHAEVVAIRNACRDLGSFSLAGATVYTSCEPCPMCLSAIYWARIGRIVYANGRDDAASIGFDDAFLYTEIALPLEQRAVPMQRLLADEARAVFDEWAARPDRVPY